MRARSRCRPRLDCEQLESRSLMAADVSLPMLDIGSSTLIDVWVDPVRGDDSASGAVREQALRTVTEAWRRVPSGVPLTTGFRINLAAGT